jgi:Tfp pilus assembly protein PilF
MGVHFDRGQALFDLKRYADAIAEYQQELAEAPNCFASQANIAAALINLGRSGEARRNIEQTLGMAPNYAYAHYLLSFIESNSGPNSRAEQAIAEAIRLDHSALNFTRKATLLRLQQRHAECLAVCDEALARDARFQPAMLLRARTLQALDRPEEAAEVLRVALTLNPEDPDAHRALGSVALAAGDPAEALDALREARRIDPIQHHDREKILDAYARRMWPFLQIDLARKRYWRQSPVARWAIDAAVLTPLLALHPLLQPTEAEPSPVATIIYFLVVNALILIAMSRIYPVVLIRFAKRRELDIRWHHALLYNLRTIAGIFVAHWLGSVAAILGSFAAGVAFFSAAAAMGLRRAVDWRQQFPNAMILICCVVTTLAFMGAMIFHQFNDQRRPGAAAACWAVVLFVTWVSAAIRQTASRRSTPTVAPPKKRA